MKIKELLDRIRKNEAEGSMTYKFLKWMQKKNPENKCKVCGANAIDNELENGLCFHCWYKIKTKEAIPQVIK